MTTMRASQPSPCTPRPLGRSPAACCSDAWEKAYLRLGGDERERRKFRRRLRWLGCGAWPRNARVAEICCGRGDGLDALDELGYSRIVGVDLSPGLLRCYGGSAPVLLGDCRRLPLRSVSCDVVLVQGGLHHLDNISTDVGATLAEVRRVLRPTGRFVVVEPWRTAFLDLFHLLSRCRWLRRTWPRLDALAAMTELEHETYRQWLEQGIQVLALLRRTFETEYERAAWGKLWYVGRRIS